MKFVCNGMLLADAAFTVSKACAVKTITPILECIKLSAKNDVLTLTAYDGEISIERKIKAEVLEEGEVCVNGKLFSDFAGKISSLDVVIYSNGSEIVIEYNESETNMQTLSAEDFPIFTGEQIPEENYFETKESALKELISKVVFCCASDESRPILKGCLLEAKEGKLNATALDGFRMATSYCETLGGADMKIVCPARTLTEISRMLEGNDKALKIFADKNRLCVKLLDTIITSRLYVGEFVKKENIFPATFTTKILVERAELSKSIERASVVIRGEKNNLIVLDIKNGKILLTANSDLGKVEETVSANISGLDLKIAMNAKFLLDALKALEEETVQLSFNSAISPFTLENEEDKRCQYLILPVRTTSQS